MNIKNQLFDAIVVGSGPGGATVAKELSQRNKKVLKILATNGKSYTSLCIRIDGNQNTNLAIMETPIE